MNSRDKTKDELIEELQKLQSEYDSLKISYAKDIAECKQVEEALRESEDRFKVIASSTPDHILVQDNELRYTLVINPQLGLTEQDMLGKTDYDFLSKEEAYKLTGVKRQVIESGEPQHLVTSLISKDGKPEFFDGTYISRFNAQGNADGLIGYFRNITQHKLEEERIKTILATTMDGFYLVDTEGRILDTNEPYCSMIGYSREELLKMNVKDIEAMDTEEVIKKRIQQILKNGYAFFETKHKCKNGREIDIEASVNYIIEEQPKLFCFIRDITERKLAKEKLESEHSLLTSLINSTGDTIIFTLDRGNCYTAFNEKHREEMKRVWNVDIKIGMNLLDYMQIPELRELAKQSIDRALKGEVFWEVQYQSKADVYYEFSWNPIWQNKEVVGVTVLIKDITKSKQVEEALKISEGLFREIYDNMKSGSAIFTVINDGSKGSDYIIKKINRVGLKMEGKALDEVVGKRFIDIRPTIDSFGLIPVMKKVWETGKPGFLPSIIYKDERYSSYYENYVFKLPSGEVVTLYDDVTESKRAEEEIRILARFPSENPDPVLRVDRSGLLLFANEVCFKLLTWKLQIGKKIPSVLRKITEEALKEGIEEKIEMKHNQRSFSFIVVPVMEEGYANLYGRDITERKNTEKEVRKSKELLEDLNKRIIQILEKERSQIGMNLHDDLGQKLTAINLDIAWLKSRIGVQSQVVRDKFEDMCLIINDSIESIREISSFLRPSILFELGLVPAFNWQLKKFEKQSGVKCHFSFEQEEFNISDNISLMLYRILQESLTNVARHSEATVVEVNIKEAKNRLELLINDNGIGFDEDKVNSLTSLGIIGIKERVRSVNGKISIKGKKGHGTIIKVSIPI
jgi:PAS domain S-box-containing protein